MTGIPGDLPNWHYAMAAAARQLTECDAYAAKHTKMTTVEERMKLAEAWVAYARELTAHEQAGPPPLR